MTPGWMITNHKTRASRFSHLNTVSEVLRALSRKTEMKIAHAEFAGGAGGAGAEDVELPSELQISLET